MSDLFSHPSLASSLESRGWVQVGADWRRPDGVTVTSDEAARWLRRTEFEERLGGDEGT